MAQFRTSYSGNLALETQIWDLSLDEANAVIPLLQTGAGSYWDTTLVRPYRRAKRGKSETVRVYTAGFSTGQFSNALYAAGCNVQNMGNVV